MKQPYLVSHYGYYTCSECGVKYSEEEYFKYYSLDKIMRYHINCKKCGAVLHEEPKRCYWSEHHPNSQNACGDCKCIDGIPYCTRQLRAYRERLKSWGSYYKCECFEKPESGIENKTDEKEKSMTQFEIIMRTDTPELPAEIGNFEEVKAAISEALEQYSTDAVVTEETVKDAEKTRAHLRRVKDQVEQYRKDAKAAYLEKFNKLETQCKELSGMIEQPISAIDTKIKEFENAESEKKYSELQTFFTQIGAPEWLRLDDVLNPKWKNKTATIAKLRQEISEAVCKIEDDFAEIEKMYGASPLWTAISDKFKETKDKSKTLVYAAQIERQHSEEQKRAEAIQKAREEQARAEAAQNALREPEAPQAVTQPEIVQNVTQANPAASERLYRGKFLVEGTKEQIKALAAFLKSNGIRYEVIK